jgi:hypothetical protein
LSDVSQSYAAHYAYYAGLRGIAAESAANGETAVSRQYAGRVAFELLQNALDRADSRALVRRDSDWAYLVVANDGRAVSCDPKFKLESPITNGNLPSDFHSLCSMHTSNKNPEKDNGNKGVGFRSVFSVASRVYVWSRLRTGEWWGILLLRDLSTDTWLAACGESHVEAGLNAILPDMANTSPISNGERRPSFHFPLPLFSDVAPLPEIEWAQTAIVLPCDEDGSVKSISESIFSLSSTHLEFLGLRNKKPVHVEIDAELTLVTALSENNVVARWDVVSEVGKAPDPLFALAKNAGLDLTHRIGGAVRWPDANRASGTTGRVYCYLATEVPCPFGIDIHADLQTGIDRKHLEVKETEAVGAYNRALLMRSLDLHIQQIEAYAHERDDLWAMLDPGTGLSNLKSNDEPVRHLLAMRMREYLFGGLPTSDHKSWGKWASLAARCFSTRKRPGTTFVQFWNASEHWINAVSPSGSSRAKALAEACLTALRYANARVVPITGQGGEVATGKLMESVAPPLAGEAGTKSAEKLFHVTQEQREQFSVLAMPSAVSDRGRRVTAWEFPEPFRKEGRLIGSIGFFRASLLQELRQLSAASALDDSGHLHLTEGIARQTELIIFAARVFLLPVREGQSTKAYADDRWAPGWRADRDENISSDLMAAGRGVATLFLPTADGAWEPARQLKYGQVAPCLISQLEQIPGLKVDDFLCFIGVAVRNGQLPLVEAGDDGVVLPRLLPPSLCDAGTGQRIPPLRVPVGLEEDRSTLANRLNAAWCDGWAKDLADRESRRPERIEVFKVLAGYEWYPVGDSYPFALPPTRMVKPPLYVSPNRLTLLASKFQRAEEAVWRTRVDSRASEDCLRALGARALDERLEDASLAAALIRDLAVAYPDAASVVHDYPPLRFVLIELFNRAMSSVVKGNKTTPWPHDLPLLAEAPNQTGRGVALRWCRADELYVASEKYEREVVRRHAPNLVLLVTPVGPNQARDTPIEARTIKVSSTINADDALVDADVHRLRELLFSLLPRLLAVAEVSRRYNREIDAALVAKKWWTMELRRSRDVWRRWTLSACDFKHDPDERKGQYDDVMYETGHNKEDSSERSIIYYDVPPVLQTVAGEFPHPPLVEFAEALAAILLDGQVEPDWRAALGEFEVGGMNRLDDYLARKGVSVELWESMQAGLAPLAESLLVEHREVVSRVLATFGLWLADSQWNANSPRTLLLGSQVLADFSQMNDATEEDVNKALATADFPTSVCRFVPRFDATSFHLKQWNEFARMGQRTLRLLRYKYDKDESEPNQISLKDVDLVSGDLAESLNEFVRCSAGKLNFDPERVARAWLGNKLPSGPLDGWLPEFSIFQPVTSSPVVAKLRTLSASIANSSKSTALPTTPDERNAESAAKVAKGDGAELAMLAWVVPKTHELLAGHFGEKAWVALLGAFPSSGVARKRLEEVGRAATEDELREALWVSRRWRGSGFDIVGLTQDGDAVVPSRYEVKALPDESNVRVFISTNEIAVYRETRTSCLRRRKDLQNGTWDLVGVRKNGEALILTEALLPVVDPAVGGLKALAVDGFSAESLQLVMGID